MFLILEMDLITKVCYRDIFYCRLESLLIIVTYTKVCIISQEHTLLWHSLLFNLPLHKSAFDHIIEMNLKKKSFNDVMMVT